MGDQNLSKNELTLHLRELDEEYRLARSGLFMGGATSLFAIIAVVLTFFVATSKMELLSGNNIVMIVGIVAAAIVIYFSFIFRRIARVRLEISKTRALLEMGSGEKA